MFRFSKTTTLPMLCTRHLFLRCVTCLIYKKSFSVRNTVEECPREYWIIYKRPGFLAFVRFGSSSTPFRPPLPSVSCLSFFLSLPVCCRSTLLTGEGGGGGQGAKSYDREKAWGFSLSHSMVSGVPLPQLKLNLECFNSPQKEKQILKEGDH